MDFARKQLEKYGWTDGKGLGKHENGISEALKPKLKRSVTGVGHDAAAEFTEHWWTKLYNSAANNVEVKEENGTTKNINTKDDEFEITNSSWSYKKKNKNKSKDEYTNFFVRTSILTSGGSKTEDLNMDTNEEETVLDVVKLSDEELFKACEGRTAHKGARHGLKALGKLARIEMQERALLQQSKYNGYSKANDVKSNNETTASIDSKKKKKKKHSEQSESVTDQLDNNECVDAEIELSSQDNSCYKKKKHKKKKNAYNENIVENDCTLENDDSKDSKNVRQSEIEEQNECNESTQDQIPDQVKSKKKKKRKMSAENKQEEIDNEIETEVIKKKKKKKKKCD